MKEIASSASGFCDFVKDHVSNTIPEVIEKIDKSKQKTKDFVGILDYYSFEFNPKFTKNGLPFCKFKLHAKSGWNSQDRQFFE